MSNLGNRVTEQTPGLIGDIRAERGANVAIELVKNDSPHAPG